MQTIRDLLSRDLSEQIEEVIKVDQQDEQTVHNELTEYVFTERIQRQYRELLDAIAEGPSDSTEGVGVWISGFFGSGKSSFAKNLGYILANYEVLGQPASELFVQQLEEQAPGDPDAARIQQLVNYINARLDTEVIMFDVQVDRAVRRHTEPIAEIMYSVLLRELDYARDYDVAELEIELEAEGRLGDFVLACAERYSDLKGHPEAVPPTLEGVSEEDYGVWRRVRKGAQRIQRASAALHDLDPTTYPSEDSWAQSMQGTEVRIRTLVDRTFELMDRRRPGRAAVYIIDEVGQYVARSVEKIENLRAVVEHFGQESKNRVQKGEAPAPVWVIVTSQEKLDEVVAAIDDKRVQLSRLQDRFKHRIDMAPADIREVATRRVLTKKPEAESVLAGLYDQKQAILKTHTRLERTARSSDVARDDFVQFYPYLPHFVDLSIGIVSGMRLEAGAPRHIGGSNRTIIKQAYEMLVSDRTKLADAPVGELVTLDRIYDLIEGNLPSERQSDINDVMQTWAAADDPWPARVAKAIALLEYVRDLPRTEANIAALLYRRLGDPSPIAEVERAVERLEKAEFIRQTENGWTLQTAQEKSWTTERNALSPVPREEHDLLEDSLRDIFSDASLTKYRYGKGGSAASVRTFRVGVMWENRSLTSGSEQIPLELRVADGPQVFDEACARAREDSRAESHKNEVFWVMHVDDEVDDLVVELYRSKQMVSKYDQLRAQNKINQGEATSLATERQHVQRLESRLEERLRDALAAGRGFFRGVSKDGAALGKTFAEALKGMLDFSVPDLYPRLEMGARPLAGDEAVEILKAANLNGLSKIFYGPPDGLDLVTREEGKYVVNLKAEILREVYDYLKREHSYGNKVTGRTLENHFGGLGYGWEREILWLVMATLLRGAAIQVTYQGRRYRNHLDPQVRAAFSGTNAFRAASFAPRESIDLRTLVSAARRYEEITGKEVDVEEVAIAHAFQELAEEELEALLPVEATVKAHDIPVPEGSRQSSVLEDYHTTLETVLNSPSDDCVRILAGEGASFQELRDQVDAIRRATDEEGLAFLRELRRVIGQIWPQLQHEGLDGELENYAQSVKDRLADGTYYQVRATLKERVVPLEAAYEALYEGRHAERGTAFALAADSVKGHPDWTAVPEEMQEALLEPLVARDHDVDISEGALTCRICHASLSEMASDLAAVDGLRAKVLRRFQELTAPEEKIESVRVTDVLGMGRTLGSDQEVEEALDELSDHVRKLIASGAKVVLE